MYNMQMFQAGFSLFLSIPIAWLIRWLLVFLIAVFSFQLFLINLFLLLPLFLSQHSYVNIFLISRFGF